MEKYLLSSIKTKLELITLKSEKKILKEEYDKACNEYNAFLTQKEIEENKITNLAIEITKRRDTKITISIILYFLLCGLSIFTFNKVFAILKISNDIGALLSSVLVNLCIGVPILCKNITSILKKEEKEFKEVMKKKQTLIETENNLNNFKNISLSNYLGIKRREQNFIKFHKIKVNKANGITPTKRYIVSSKPYTRKLERKKIKNPSLIS